MGLERVIVGIDGSGGGEDALEWAIDWARRSGAEVVAVFAVGLLWDSRSGHPVPGTNPESIGRRQINIRIDSIGSQRFSIVFQCPIWRRFRLKYRIRICGG